MTSEGQHAGQQPAEATSGGDGFPSAEFPPDQDENRPLSTGQPAAPQTAWGPDAYPDSYGPPPSAQPGGVSPFVVPAVPVFSPSTAEGPRGGRPTAPDRPPSAGYGPAISPSGFGSEPASGFGASRPARLGSPASAESGSAAPSGFGPARWSASTPGSAAISGSARVPGASAPASGSASAAIRSPSGSAPVRPASGSAPVRSASGSAPAPVRPAAGSARSSAWAPPPAPERPGDEANPFARPAAFVPGPDDGAADPAPSGAASPDPSSGSAADPPSGSTSGRPSSLPGGTPGGPIGADPADPADAVAHPYREEPHPYRPDPDVRPDAEPHPYRSAAPAQPAPAQPAPAQPAPAQPRPAPSLPALPSGGFNGFDPINSKPPSTPRASTESIGQRPPGISAFGDQRVRVPGATLGDLPDGRPVGGLSDPSSRSGPPHPAGDEAAGPHSAEAVPADPGPAQQAVSGFPIRDAGVPNVRPGDGGYPSLVAPPQKPAPQSFTPSRAAASGIGVFGGVVADSAAVPQPRTPAEAARPLRGPGGSPVQAGSGAAPVAGAAGPVSASASVPLTSRVFPPVGGDALPPSPAPKTRVYGRGATPAEPAGPAAGYHDPPAGQRELTAADQRTGYPLSPAAAPPPARATASARVTAAPPSAPPVQDGTPYAEPTTDMAGRGRGAVAPQPPYGEFSTDLTGRGRPGAAAYVPTPALPTLLHPSAPPADGRGGGFPGPAGRAAQGPAFPGQARTIGTPPSPSEPTSWPDPAEDGEPGRFASVKPEMEADGGKAEAPPHVRKLPVLIVVLLVSALLVGGALGIVWLLARPASGFHINVGQCVRQNGPTAVTASCGDAGSFEVVSKVDTKEQCADPNLPYVVNPAGNGRDRVLCLRATG
jgi:hypothetical protein